MATVSVGGGGGCAVTVSVAVLLTPPYAAVMLTDVAVLTVCVDMVTVVLVAPPAIVTLAGTLATAALLLESVTLAPPEGAALVSVTVPCTALPPTALVGLSVNAESAAGPGGGACAVNLRVTDQGPATPAELMPRTRHHNRLAGSELVVKVDTAAFWLTICGALNVLASSI